MVVTTKKQGGAQRLGRHGISPQIDVVFPAHHLLAEPREGQDLAIKTQTEGFEDWIESEQNDKHQAR
jgi:hypothetical protein